MLTRLLIYLILPALIPGCSCRPGSSNTQGEQTGLPLVVATTTIIADMAENLCGGRMQVKSLMRPGEDPHIYDPRPLDARLISQAKIVLSNGLHLEGTLQEIIRNNLAQGAIHLALAEDPRIKPIESQQYKGAPDPHCWFNLKYFKIYTERAMTALIQCDPEGEETYRANAARYLAELDSLDRYTRNLFSKIPSHRRILVTAHDAFRYFGLEYGIEVMGVIGISTDQEPRPQDVEKLISAINEKHVTAVFIESSVAPALNNLVRKIAEKTGARIGGSLYSDSLGEPEGPAGTFIKMFRHNVDTIAEALMKGNTAA